MTLVFNGMTSSLMLLVIMGLAVWLWAQFAPVWVAVVFGWAAGGMTDKACKAVEQWWRAGK